MKVVLKFKLMLINALKYASFQLLNFSFIKGINIKRILA